MTVETNNKAERIELEQQEEEVVFDLDDSASLATQPMEIVVETELEATPPVEPAKLVQRLPLRVAHAVLDERGSRLILGTGLNPSRPTSENEALEEDPLRSPLGSKLTLILGLVNDGPSELVASSIDFIALPAAAVTGDTSANPYDVPSHIFANGERLPPNTEVSVSVPLLIPGASEHSRVAVSATLQVRVLEDEPGRVFTVPIFNRTLHLVREQSVEEAYTTAAVLLVTFIIAVFNLFSSYRSATARARTRPEGSHSLNLGAASAGSKRRTKKSS
jgi:hypothetical protein